jgi:mono/diheme cytochrome c family protein
MQNENYTKLQIIGLVLTVILIAAMTMAFVTESSRLETVTAAAEKASLQRGRQLYVDNCVSCHGSRGEGGVGLALNNSVFLKKASNDVIFATIASGRPSTVMPAWGQLYGGAFTDEEIRDIVSFIRAWEPTAPVVRPLSLCRMRRGARLMTLSALTVMARMAKASTMATVEPPSRSTTLLN